MKAMKAMKAMKTLLFVGLVVGSLFAHSFEAASSVNEIRQDVFRIRSSLSTCQKTKRTLLDISSEGAAVTAYSKGTIIQKIAVEALGETGKYLADFYFQNGQLIFSYVRVIDYGAHIMESQESKDFKAQLAEEERLYFANGKLIRWLKGKEQVLPSTPGYREKEQSVLSEAQSFILLMKTAAPKGGEDSCNWACVHKKAARCVRYQCN